LTAVLETSATEGLVAPRTLAAWTANSQKVAEDQKQDFVNIKAALVDLVEVAGRYGVK
jgi:hypothetical protein